MNRALLFFADLEPGDILAAHERFLNSRHSREVFIVSGSLFFAIVLAVAGVVVYVKRKKRKRHHRHHSSQDRRAQAQLAAVAQSEAARKKGRRRRRSQPPMNPTLAETGGLPPIRESNPHP